MELELPGHRCSLWCWAVQDWAASVLPLLWELHSHVLSHSAPNQSLLQSAAVSLETTPIHNGPLNVALAHSVAEEKSPFAQVVAAL